MSTFQAQLNPDLSTGNADPHENAPCTLDIKSSDASLDIPGGGDGGIKEDKWPFAIIAYSFIAYITMSNLLFKVIC